MCLKYIDIDVVNCHCSNVLGTWRSLFSEWVIGNVEYIAIREAWANLPRGADRASWRGVGTRTLGVSKVMLFEDRLAIPLSNLPVGRVTCDDSQPYSSGSHSVFSNSATKGFKAFTHTACLLRGAQYEHWVTAWWLDQPWAAEQRDGKRSCNLRINARGLYAKCCGDVIT